ncbi:MAG: hypothetical protein ACK4NR_08215 [Micavibrio sp.]
MMILAEELDAVANDNKATALEVAVLACVFNDCAGVKSRRRRIQRDFFTNEGPRFRPFSTRAIRRARIARSRYPAYRGDK